MPQKVQVLRTATSTPPAALLEGELSVEMGIPARLWAGVPTAIDVSGRKLLASAHASLITNEFLPNRLHVNQSTFGVIDLNNIIENGWCLVSADTTNNPSGMSAGGVYVLSNGDSIQQFAYPSAEDAVAWSRFSNDRGATWSVWANPWLDSPVFVGTPQAPTIAYNTRGTYIATTQYVGYEIENLEKSFGFSYLVVQADPVAHPVVAGDLLIGSADPNLITTLWISYTTSQGFDVKNKLQQLVKTGTYILINDADPAEQTGKWAYVLITSDGIDQGTYWEVTAQYVAGAPAGFAPESASWMMLMHPPIMHTVLSNLIHMENEEPPLPRVGQMWWNPDTSKTKVWDGTCWLERH